MPRVARTVFAGLPHYVTQGGNLRENVFFLTDAHSRTYLIGLKEYCKRHGVEILAYCLMSNPIHLGRDTGRRRCPAWRSATLA